MLWNVQFLIYLVYMTLAGAIANWYFTPRHADGGKMRGDGDRELSHTPIWDSVVRTVRFHIGTVAFASLIIAIVQFIRYCVNYLQDTLKKCTGDPCHLQKICFCVLKCCIGCVECCLDKVSKTALIWTAIWGSSFGPACCSSFKFLWENLNRVAALALVSGYLMVLGKVVVSLITTGLCGVFLQRYYDENLNSLAMPMAIIFLLSYMVSTLFMIAFEVTIDTVFFCFLVDEKVNGGAGNMYAHKSLIDVVNKHQPESERLAARLKSKGQPQGIEARPQP